jgi:16S rRNA (cytosine1402-N4)-methyltransferase
LDFTNHAPVMVEESLALLLPQRGERANETFVDATFGAGGHTKEILARIPGCRVIALDADPDAIERAKSLSREYEGRLVAVHANYADLGERLDEIGIVEVDGILYDLGLSSMQLADSGRGFSFAGDEPLDMRLDSSSNDSTAADLLATLSERELADLIFDYGDERYARRIARQIVTRRERSPLRTTSDLVAAILSARPREARRTAIHPATRTFQALRIAVNREAERLETSLATAIDRLRPGGRTVVISFHSGEDRTVKLSFKRWQQEGRATVVTRKPLVPTTAEVAANPASRSAKLRAAEKSARPIQGGS